VFRIYTSPLRHLNKKTVFPLIATAAVVLLTVIYLLLLAGRRIVGSGLVRADSGVHLVMGTFARVVVIADDVAGGNQCVESALDEIHNVDNLMSDYKEDSEISRVNKNAFARPVKVGPATFEVIRKSIEISKLTDGAFDITVGPLVKLFRTARDTGKAPAPEQIADAKAKVGYEKLILNDEERTVRFTVDGMALDLGGIAKGYAVDMAIEATRRHGALGAMVDLGGHIRCFGTPPQGKKTWTIGLQDPKNDGGPGILLKLTIEDAAVTTSGDYQQYAVIDGKRHSHILDRKTGDSVQGLSSVTIIADNATTADALATGVTVMGPQKGLELIESMRDTAAILVSPAPDYKITKSSAAEKFIK
jgi:thiamine biosynthesis lipoprotein